MLCVPSYLVLRGLWSSLCFPSTPFLIPASSWPRDSCVLFCLPFISGCMTHCSVVIVVVSSSPQVMRGGGGGGGGEQQQSSLGFAKGWTFYSN